MKFYKRANFISIGLIALALSVFAGDVLAQNGEELFKAKCSACHSTSARKVVGPGLEGISETREKEWLYSWIKGSQALVASGDTAAIRVFESNNKIAMPDNDFTNAEIDAILAYIDQSNAAPLVASNTEVAADKADSPVAFDILGKYTKSVMWLMIIVLIVLVIVAFRTFKYTKKILMEMGYFPEPFQRKKRGLTFAIMLVSSVVLILLLVIALQGEWGRVNQLMFFMFPYATLLIFIVGSIYRYKKSSFQVSSLSSQFLEGKKLFFGSQPFHWGLMVLFFGHLIAFLFPSALMAWNGKPVRLLILEYSSVAFALCALAGLLLLIRRRMFSRRILEVTNNMDMLVYVILLVQILSGLAVAFFVRWGSSWFAAVLTPYLKSIFVLNPDIAAISAAPWQIQIHIISAFFIIAILPFTRFMHFLVGPLDYTWRRQQLVYWNWNRRAIRNTTRYFFGRKPRNH